MEILMGVVQGLNGLLGLGGLICAILVLIRLYNVKGTSDVIWALICPIWLFIWGWQNADHFGFAPQMRAWKLCVLGQIVCVVLFVAIAAMVHG